MAHSNPALAIVIASKNRWDLLDQCILSLNKAIQATGKSDIEIIVGISGEAPEKNNLSRADQVYSFPAAFSAPQKRNQLLQKSSADWIFFCDDDVEVPDSIFVKFFELKNKFSDVNVFGGPNLNPESSNTEQLFQGQILGSKFLNPLFSARYSKQSPRKTGSSRFFCLCNLFVKRTVDLHFSHLDFCGEELQLLRELRLRSGRFYYSPDLWVYHHRRKTREEFISQVQAYGRGRGIYLSRNRPVISNILRLLVPIVPSATRTPIGAYVRGIGTGLSNTKKAAAP